VGALNQDRKRRAVAPTKPEGKSPASEYAAHDGDGSDKIFELTKYTKCRR
jgi:hypothetical protein